MRSQLFEFIQLEVGKAGLPPPQEERMAPFSLNSKRGLRHTLRRQGSCSRASVVTALSCRWSWSDPRSA